MTVSSALVSTAIAFSVGAPPPPSADEVLHTRIARLEADLATREAELREIRRLMSEIDDRLQDLESTTRGNKFPGVEVRGNKFPDSTTFELKPGDSYLLPPPLPIVGLPQSVVDAADERGGFLGRLPQKDRTLTVDGETPEWRWNGKAWSFRRARR